MSSIDEACVKTIRFLSVDQVEAAKSGHPGMPLGAAPMAYVIFDRFLRFNPRNPRWFNRDRFVLSAGHGCALLYSILHLYGYDLSLEELKNFRQWNSMTPGHPEYGHTPGVEATTGPLGQGFGMGVGMAIAEAYLAAHFNPKSGGKVVDHYTYAIVSDGDLMEGVASEAASLAGHLGLGKLIYLYDDNHISIDGETELAFTEDVGARFSAYNWHMMAIDDGNDLDAIEAAIKTAQAETKRPSLIRVRTHIGYGSPKQDTAGVHGSPLGPEAAIETKEAAGWPTKPPFYVPDDVRPHFAGKVERGVELEAQWAKDFEAYKRAEPDTAGFLELAIRRELPKGWDKDMPVFAPDDKGIATRAASGKILNALAPALPNLIGGSADLAPSNNTFLKEYPVFGNGAREGRNFHFGVREHAMGAVVNGMALHGGVIPYGGTFLIFSDYMRPSIRVASIMNVPSIFVFTHDSVGLGEDGPTHQPIEHLASLRAMPRLVVIRPADANETAAAWRIAIEHDGPVALALTRQGLPILDAKKHPIAAGVPKGGYILSEAATGKPHVVIIATGSEVSLALEAQEALAGKDIAARVVSMPSTEIFDRQPESYRREVLPPDTPKLSVEAATPLGWRKYVGDKGAIVGIDRFGASAPGKTVLTELGINLGNVVEQATRLAAR